MEDRCRMKGYKFGIVVGICALIAFRSGLAQQASSPSLDEILQKLESNRQRYDTQVPSFFCNEHVLSSLTYGKKRQSVVTDSIFRVRRGSEVGVKGTLSESREVNAVNGTPAEGAQFRGPAVLGGVFSGGLDTVSLSQKACMRYTLEPVQSDRPDEPYIVEFERLPGSQRDSGCVLNERGSGRVFIDRASMQVRRMELTAPNHVIQPSTVVVWKVAIDYAPVLLGEQTFWMPATIVSTATAADEGGQTIWSFDARYTDYHKLEVTSRIVP
jgi:hypothetical protein